MTLILTLLAVLFAAIHITAEFTGPVTLIYIFKPLVMACIITLAFLVKTSTEQQGKYKKAILAGLGFSIVGDVLLMPPQTYFVIGLVSFLIGHLIYIYAFSREKKFRPWAWIQIPILLYGVGIYFYLSPGLGDMRIPVIAYILVILLMFWQAWDQWDQTRQKWALLAMIGALFFIAADTLLAMVKFLEIPYLFRGFNLASYFTAQWLIANSIRRE